MGAQPTKSDGDLQGMVSYMIVVGEKINGTILKTAEAIKNRDEAYILSLVRLQAEAGADYLDVCAGTNPENEYDALCWLLDVVQAHTELPICIDSPDARVIELVFPKLKMPGLINSISGEGEKCDVLLPVLQDNPEWQVIALCSDNKGVAVTADDKIRISSNLLDQAAKYGIAPKRMHVDLLVLALSAVNSAATDFCESIGRLHSLYPEVKTLAALSNISFGMPARDLVNRNFMTMAMCAGLDTVICDPTSRELAGNLLATQALLGQDKYCRKFSNAFRAGKIGPVKKN